MLKNLSTQVGEKGGHFPGHLFYASDLANWLMKLAIIVLAFFLLVFNHETHYEIRVLCSLTLEILNVSGLLKSYI